MRKMLPFISAVSIIFTVIAASAVFLYLQNNALTVTDIHFRSEKLPESFNGLKIVQISDLHNKQFGKDNIRLIKKINSLEPDIIFITGDIVNDKASCITDIVTFISQLKVPVYFSTGNHERNFRQYDTLKAEMKNLGVTVLEDEKTYLEKNGEKIAITGFHMNLWALDELIDEDEFNLLLMHYPENIDFFEFDRKKPDLIFAGHAHGGQWRLPFIGGVFSSAEGFFPEHTAGLYLENGTAMVVSRGLGPSAFPLRLFNMPDIVLVTLEK